MSEMKFEINREDLQAHLVARAEHYAKKSLSYQADADKADHETEEQLSAAETVTDRLNIKNSTIYDATVKRRDAARGKYFESKDRAAAFRFYADHLPLSWATVRLTTSELAQFELTPAVRYAAF